MVQNLLANVRDIRDVHTQMNDGVSAMKIVRNIDQFHYEQ